MLSDVTRDFARIDPSIQSQSAHTRAPPPASALEAYPQAILSRLSWALELVLTFRFIGWHTPRAPPRTLKDVLPPQSPQNKPPPERLAASSPRYFLPLILRFTIAFVILDFIVWILRYNDPTYFLPHLYVNSPHGLPNPLPGAELAPAWAIYRNLTLSTSVFRSAGVGSWYLLLPPTFPREYPGAGYPVRFFLPRPGTASWGEFVAHSTGYETIYSVVLYVSRMSIQWISVYAIITACSTLMTLIFLPFSILSHHLLPPTKRHNRWLDLPTFFPRILAPPLPLPSSLQEFWSHTWHCLFRRTFLRPWVALQEVLGMRPGEGKMGVVAGAFVMSGVTHWVGVYALYHMHDRDTNLARSLERVQRGGGGTGAVMFFWAQVLGVGVEDYVRRRWGGKMGGWGETVGKVWTVAWFVATGGWFFDEFRWGGLWLVEPWGNLWVRVLG